MNEEIGHLFTVITTIVLITLLVVTFGWFYESNQLNSFNQAARQTITRNDGLNDSTQAQLNKLSRDKFHNMFVINRKSDADKEVEYGHVVNYSIKATLPALNKNISPVVATKHDSVIASVRPGSTD